MRTIAISILLFVGGVSRAEAPIQSQLPVVKEMYGETLRVAQYLEVQFQIVAEKHWRLEQFPLLFDASRTADEAVSELSRAQSKLRNATASLTPQEQNDKELAAQEKELENIFLRLKEFLATIHQKLHALQPADPKGPAVLFFDISLHCVRLRKVI